jgi:hypothetical protein
MTWLTFLTIAVVIAAFAAITGFKPAGTRHVARTGLMSAARVALLVFVAIVAYLTYRAQSGG